MDLIVTFGFVAIGVLLIQIYSQIAKTNTRILLMHRTLFTFFYDFSYKFRQGCTLSDNEFRDEWERISGIAAEKLKKERL